MQVAYIHVLVHTHTLTHTRTHIETYAYICMQVPSNIFQHTKRNSKHVPRHMYFWLDKEVGFPHPEFQQFQFAFKCLKIQSPRPRPKFSLTPSGVIDLLVKKRKVSQKRTPSLYTRFACRAVLSSRKVHFF